MAYGPKEGVPQVMGELFDWVTMGTTPTGTHKAVLSSHENRLFRSQSNPFKNGHYTAGGHFLSMKIERVVYPSASFVTYREGWSKAYEGRYTCPSPDPYYPDSAWGTERPDRPDRSYADIVLNNMNLRGAEAWAKMRPDKPDFSLATSLYELKDVVPDLKSGLTNLMNKMKKHPKMSNRKDRSPISRVAQYHLALNFGWLPLLRDIRDFVKAQSTKQATLDQLIRDEGRPVRRRCKLNDPDDRGNEPISDAYYPVDNGYGSNYHPVHVTQCYTGWGYNRERVFQNSRMWAEGRFRYYLPPGPKTVAWKKKMLRRIMGVRVTPAMVYNAMPWSWLVDYFSDLGTFVNLVSGGVADRLAADYAYIMKETTWTRSRECQGMTFGDVKGLSKPNKITMISETKTITKARTRASPFGWGIKQTDLTPKQWAILGALGLSRLP